MSAFFVSVICTLLIAPPAFSGEICSSPDSRSLENATVKWVYDGDTLLLTDKRKIRIIGIDTPETRHHKQQGEAYGAKAREALREKLKRSNYSIKLLHGKQRKDKYARVLAHVFLKDGTNISTWLLDNGYAKTLAIPPNVKFATCYKNSEINAQQNKLKIWKEEKNQLQDVSSIGTNIGTKTKGYVRIKGELRDLKKHKKSITFTIKSNHKRPIQVIIRNKNLRYFESVNLYNLIGKSIGVSGMLKNKRNKRIIYLNHPSQLQVIAGKQIKPMIKWGSK